MNEKVIERNAEQDFYKQYIERFNYICDKYADCIAMSCLHTDDSITSVTFSEMKKCCQKIADKIEEMGIGISDRVAVVSPHSIETVLVGYSLTLLHTTIVPMDVSLPKEELNRLLKFADVSCIYTTDEKYPLLDEDIKADIPILKFNKSGELELYSDSVRKCTKSKQAAKDPEVAGIIFSSGTTSQAKGIMVTYEAVVNSRPVYIQVSGLKPGMKLLHVLPFNHIAGFMGSFYHTAEGCRLCFIAEMDSSKLQKGLVTFNPEFFAMVPKVYEVIQQKICIQIKQKSKIFYYIFRCLLALSGLSRKYLGINWGKLLFKGIYSQVFGNGIIGVGTGAAACPGKTAKFFLDMGLLWANFYASTEVGVPFISTGILDKYPYNTVGKIDRDSEIQVKINNPGENGTGEIYAKSKLMMKGYFREPELTQKAFEDGWFKTGDIGYVDKHNYLHINGRKKETILLHNGKKVAPTDIEAFYQSTADGVNIAVCGIHNESGFDEIHMFIETGTTVKQKAEKAKETILSLSRSQDCLYKINAFHFIEKIPVTSVGKVKRYMLQEFVNIPENKTEAKTEVSIENTVKNTIRRIIKYKENIPLSASLRNELDMDSLSLFELAAELESLYGKDVCSSLDNIDTVNDLVLYISNTNMQIKPSEIDISDFPIAKTPQDIKRLKRFMMLSKSVWRFDVKGIENIPTNENYILCPNHQSHFDSLWIWAAIGADKIDAEKICCLAKKEHLDNTVSKRWIKMLGAIPVDRSGNSAPAMKRALQCVNSGYSILIHPEGTRTKIGELGTFRNGAAKLAIDCGKKIIPVYIGGAFEIFPYNRAIPKFFNFKNLKRYMINISFGTPIEPFGKSKEELTKEIRNCILKMENSAYLHRN